MSLLLLDVIAVFLHDDVSEFIRWMKCVTVLFYRKKRGFSPMLCKNKLIIIKQKLGYNICYFYQYIFEQQPSNLTSKI